MKNHLAEAEIKVREADKTLQELSQTVAGQQADYLELARRLAAQKAEYDALKQRVTTRAIEIAELDTRLSTKKQETETALAEQEHLQQAHQTARKEYTKCEATVQESRLLRDEAELLVQKTAERRREQERDLALTSARLRVLEETEAAQEGYFAGVKAVTRAVQNGKLQGRYIVFADAIRVPEHLDTAIETALGASIQDIICDTEVEAKNAIRHLNDNREGRATFLPMDRLRSVDIPDSFRSLPRKNKAVLGSAADLINFEDVFSPAIYLHLARVLIVEDLETATQVSRNQNDLPSRDWARIVTLSGEVVVPTGAITGGRAQKQSSNLLGRKREILELVEAQKKAENAHAKLSDEQISTISAEKSARIAVQEAEKTLLQERDKVAETARQIQSTQAELQRANAESEGVFARKKSFQEATDKDQAIIDTLEAALENSNTQDDSAHASREELQRRQAALSVRKSEAQEEARRWTTERALLRERVQTQTRDAERARQNAERATLTASQREERATEARQIIATETGQLETQTLAITEAQATVEKTTADLERGRERRQALIAENFQLRERIKLAEKNRQNSTEQAQQARLRLARLETQAEVIAQRLLEEYELHPDSAVALTGGKPVSKDIAQEIMRLRREIKSLGLVNTGAIEEYARVSERHVFLSTQKTDLEDARASLLSAITEIDESTRGVFLETYEAVGKAFDRLFHRLFGGGETQLVLTTPEDILETGIEILVQAPGKKRQNLALLSGGERALTATALLFAFLEVRPSPFCILDEVDAPLDGANVEKFADLLRDFGKTSQFIVVTHNATTMEAAPLWYGVTMQEPGVSKGLSMRVPES